MVICITNKQQLINTFFSLYTGYPKKLVMYIFFCPRCCHVSSVWACVATYVMYITIIEVMFLFRIALLVVTIFAVCCRLGDAHLFMFHTCHLFESFIELKVCVCVCVLSTLVLSERGGLH